MAQPAVRILLVGLPRLLRDLVEGAIARRDDAVLVGEATRGDDGRALDRLAADTHANVVIAGIDEGHWPPPCEELIVERTGLRLVGVDDGLGRTRVLELRSWTARLGDLTPDEIVELAISEAS